MEDTLCNGNDRFIKCTTDSPVVMGLFVGHMTKV